jgi:hypothetical protein
MRTPETWDDFAALVEANNGVWGGCWCMGLVIVEGLASDWSVIGNGAGARTVWFEISPASSYPRL